MKFYDRVFRIFTVVGSLRGIGCLAFLRCEVQQLPGQPKPMRLKANQSTAVFRSFPDLIIYSLYIIYIYMIFVLVLPNEFLLQTSGRDGTFATW